MSTKNIKYIIIFAVLLLPFIYSFFYLKAYWDPYGKGNIDNLDVAIVNLDKGKSGAKLVKSIRNTKKLKLNVVSEEEALDGLNNSKYYAVISIPRDFTSSIESAADEDKHHPTITYSPNQKTNYLSSQIINSVVNGVEEALDNEINSSIVSSLSDTVEEVPEKLDKISDGFDKLGKGTGELTTGSMTLFNGTSTLNDNYNTFNEGISSLKNGSRTLKEGTSKLNDGIITLDNSVRNFDDLINGINTLAGASNSLKNGSDTFTNSLSSYTNSVNLVFNKLSSISSLCSSSNMEDLVTCSSVINLLNQPLNNIILLYDNYPNHNGIDDNTYYLAKNMIASNENYANVSLIQILQGSSDALLNGNKEINNGINGLNTGISSMTSVNDKIKSLQNGISSLRIGSNNLLYGVNNLNQGIDKLYGSSLQIRNGINNLNGGAFRLNNGLNTLNSSVTTAKNDLDNNIAITKNNVKKVDKLSDYSKAPVNVERKEINKISSYGLAFSPFFISIGLWVGSLMMFIVFLYDRDNRFDILGMKYKYKIKRTLYYHGLISLSGVLLGFLLNLLLDFTVTNMFLYYLSIVLVANTFMSIIEFLIINFDDVGKFLGLILLVLQLAAAGGTFPIQTVSKGFRAMHKFLPMTYSINLLKECLITFEKNIFTKNFMILFFIFIILFIFNLFNDYRMNLKVSNKKK